MTRAEYKVSLRMWNYFVSRVSGYELLMCVHAWGTLGKSLTHFQSIVAAQRYTQKRVANLTRDTSLASLKAMTTIAFYKQVEGTMLYDTKRRFTIEQEENFGEEIIYFDRSL